MKILGRYVTAVQYSDTPLLNAYVHLKPGDCKRESKPDYLCLDNCEGNLLIARFMEKQLISAKALVPKEIQIHPDLRKRIKPSLSGLESAARKPGYSIENHKNGRMLYLNGQPVAVYTPCGFALEQNLWTPDGKTTLIELNEKIDEVYSIAEQKPLEDILKDGALAAQLDNPQLSTAMRIMFGPQGYELVKQIMEMRKKSPSRNQ